MQFNSDSENSSLSLVIFAKAITERSLNQKNLITDQRNLALFMTETILKNPLVTNNYIISRYYVYSKEDLFTVRRTLYLTRICILNMGQRNLTIVVTHDILMNSLVIMYIDKYTYSSTLLYTKEISYLVQRIFHLSIIYKFTYCVIHDFTFYIIWNCYVTRNTKEKKSWTKKTVDESVNITYPVNPV